MAIGGRKMKKEPKLLPPDYLCDLARKLLAAHHSYAMGISLGYAYDRYAKNIPPEDIGAYWIRLAEEIIAVDLKTKSEHFQSMVPPPDTKPIQPSEPTSGLPPGRGSP